MNIRIAILSPDKSGIELSGSSPSSLEQEKRARVAFTETVVAFGKASMSTQHDMKGMPSYPSLQGMSKYQTVTKRLRPSC